MIRCEVPLFLVIVTIGLHQVTGVSIGTLAMMPHSTSWSSTSLTVDFQWCGTGVGVCLAYDILSGWWGGHDRKRNCVVKCTLANSFSKNDSSFGMFSRLVSIAGGDICSWQSCRVVFGIAIIIANGLRFIKNMQLQWILER